MIRRKQIKRMAGCVVAVTMALTGVPVTAGTENINVEVVYADETLTYTEGNSTYTYTELSDGTLEISDYEGTDTEIVIPGEIDGKKVTSIRNHAFGGCSSLERIEIPDSVTSIGNYAFGYCSSLERIEIPSSVTYIDSSAFFGCSSLEEIEVSEENIYYKSVDGVLFNKEMTEIICYPSDKKDTVYVVPEGVTSIEGGTFCNCSSLEGVEIPSSVTSIAYVTFDECSSLEKIEVAEENIHYKSVEGVLFNKEMTEIICYPPGKKDTIYVVPAEITSIDDFAFEGCNSLEKIVIPEGVTSIGYGAFSECISLTRIEIPEGVTSIGGYAFYDCSSLESIEIPSSVTYIVYGAFSECISLTRIEIPEGVTSIESGAFYECSSLESVEIPEGVTSIGEVAFFGCSSLERIEIPSSVTSIGYGAFYGCSSLEEIEVSEENINYKSVEGVLFNKEMTEIICYPSGKKDTVYVVPKGVTSIEGYAFGGCSSLTSIEIPEGVTSIGEYAFGGCDNLIIYGKKDSYAETYAKDNDIPFIAIDEITSSDNITVIYPVDSVQGTVSLQTKKLTEADEEYKKINLEDKIIDSAVSVEDVAFTAYDISLVDENNNKVQPSQVVTVKIPCPEGYDGEKCNIYRVNDDGTFTDMKTEYERGYLVFKTNHFSVYLITETELLTTPDTISGDVNGDGTIDIKDSALLKRYLAGWEVEIDEEATDVDGDGKVTIKDSALIKRQLAGWE